ncbi:MAG: hypothetical protein JOZ46_02180 [Candidatus Dormibacteraeota bacterium]|nr:hypothetical protein [Candidatus Dormibacteraeota bacterium]MBV9524604.1 hypothetical protein [Candidatus Dormibacteraeota bacterium]
MPTYGYRCPSCSTEFDVWQRMSDEPAAACPSCGAAAHRLFFPAGIVFKGTGFYATDNRSKSGSGGDGAKKPKSSGDSASSTPPATSTDSSSTPAKTS